MSRIPEEAEILNKVEIPERINIFSKKFDNPIAT